MKPEDIIWRVVNRLNEDLDIIAECRNELHPKLHKELVDVLNDVEQLMRTQIHLLNRVRRRWAP